MTDETFYEKATRCERLAEEVLAAPNPMQDELDRGLVAAQLAQSYRIQNFAAVLDEEIGRLPEVVARELEHAGATIATNVWEALRK